MKIINKILVCVGTATLLFSCSNYKYMSENDVYSMKPSEINLDEDENDMTSYNAFKAGEKGVYRKEYKDNQLDNRLNQTAVFNREQLYNANFYTIGMGYGVGAPMSHYFFLRRMGMPYSGNPYMGIPYMGLGYGMNYYGGYPHWYNDFNTYGLFYDPFYYGYSYPYYGAGFGPNWWNNGFYQGAYYGGYYGTGYYGGGFYGGGSYAGTTHGNSTPDYNYYGKRNSISSPSSRSSNYPNTMKKSIVEQNLFNVDNKGQSRHGIQRTEVLNNGDFTPIHSQNRTIAKESIRSKINSPSNPSLHRNQTVRNDSYSQTMNSSPSIRSNTELIQQKFTPNSSFSRSNSNIRERSNINRTNNSIHNSQMPSNRNSSTLPSSSPREGGSISRGSSGIRSSAPSPSPSSSPRTGGISSPHRR